MVMGVFVLALIAAALWLGHDIPSVDDHGLGQEPAVLAPDNNAYPLLLETTNVWVKSPEWVRDWAAAMTNWDEAAATSLVQSNAEFYARLDKALARESFQSPIIHSFTDLMPGLAVYRDMGRLLRVKSEWHLRRGEKAAAVDAAVKVVLLGHLIGSENGSLIEYLVGITIKGMGLDQVLSVGLALDSPESVRVLGKLLDSYRDDAAGFERAIRAEYRFQEGALDQLGGGDLTLVQLMRMNECGPGESTKPGAWMPSRLRRGLIRLVLHPNRTKQRLVDYDAELIAGASNSLQKAFGPLAGEFEEREKGFEKGGVVRLMHRNPAGLILMDLMLPSLAAVRERAIRVECQASGVRLVLALRAYEMEKKTWPDKLEPLVPDYVPALPRDPYDGAPAFRYDPAKRLVYAVGPDFKDDGGEEGKDVGWHLGE
jgi:hypothetical protein